MFDFVKACIEARLNLFVSGGTGSGKTTTLNVLSSFIPNDERIVTIEDAAELQLRQEHVITLEARPPNLEGEGEITIRNLLRNAMHMRPDRVIVGECRAGEALDMLQAMNSGQDGSLSTGHANSPKDMLRRLETMILMTGYDLPMRAIREQMASAIDLIVHTARLKDGTRKIVNITEVYGIDDDEILTQDIFVFEQSDFVDGKIVGELKPTGIRPTFMAQFKKNGIALPPGEFGIPPEDPDKPDRSLKSRMNTGDATTAASIASVLGVGRGKTVVAGGMVYVSSVGPVDPETGQLNSAAIKDQTRQCLAEPQGPARGGRQLAREGRLGQLGAPRRVRVRPVQRGVGPLVPGRRPDRPADDAPAAATPGRLPRLARGDRRGVRLPRRGHAGAPGAPQSSRGAAEGWRGPLSVEGPHRRRPRARRRRPRATRDHA